jgi:hypothetical protein
MKQLPDVEIVKKIVVATDGGPGSIAALDWVR